MNFPQFLEQKYLDWRRAEGEKRSVQDFANYLGIRQQVLSHLVTEDVRQIIATLTEKKSPAETLSAEEILAKLTALLR